jgi:hypothetical protein
VSLLNGIKMIQVVEEAKMSILRQGTYSRKCLLEAPHDLEFPREAYVISVSIISVNYFIFHNTYSMIQYS